jgi:hypothetical protein
VASRSLNVQITGDAKGLAVATRQADGHLDGLGKKTAMVTRGMALGFAAAGAAAAGTLVVGLKKRWTRRWTRRSRRRGSRRS